jgi:hypothetical protein
MLVEFPLSLEIALTPMRSSRFKSGPRHQLFVPVAQRQSGSLLRTLSGYRNSPGTPTLLSLSSSGLGRCPLTAVTGVRLSPGTPGYTEVKRGIARIEVQRSSSDGGGADLST